MSKTFEGKKVTAELIDLLRLRAMPIGIKMFKTKEEMDQIEKLRRPSGKAYVCQILAQAFQNGFTIGCTAEDISGENCRCIVGLQEPSEYFRTMPMLKGGWFETEDDIIYHQALIGTAGTIYQGMAASPLRSERFVPDVCLIAATPGQSFMLLSGLTRSGFEPIDLAFVGESSCSRGWVKTIRTGEPGVVPPCYSELRFSNFSENEMLISLTPDDLLKAIEGLKAFYKIGLRYPVPGFGITTDPSEMFKKQYGSY